MKKVYLFLVSCLLAVGCSHEKVEEIIVDDGIEISFDINEELYKKLCKESEFKDLCKKYQDIINKESIGKKSIIEMRTKEFWETYRKYEKKKEFYVFAYIAKYNRDKYSKLKTNPNDLHIECSLDEVIVTPCHLVDICISFYHSINKSIDDAFRELSGFPASHYSDFFRYVNNNNRADLDQIHHFIGSCQGSSCNDMENYIRMHFGGMGLVAGLEDTEYELVGLAHKYAAENIAGETGDGNTNGGDIPQGGTGSTGGDPVPVPVPAPKIDETVDFLNDYRVACIYEKLTDNYNKPKSVLDDLLDEFTNDNNALLRFEVGKLGDTINGLCQSSKNLNTGEVVITIIINKLKLYRPSLAVARTILHEAMHAQMFGVLNANHSGDFPQPDFKRDLIAYGKKYGEEEGQHNYMANKYIDIMVKGLKAYFMQDDSYKKFMNYAKDSVDWVDLDTFLRNIAWTGLKNTEAWDSLKNDTTKYSEYQAQQRLLYMIPEQQPCN